MEEKTVDNQTVDNQGAFIESLKRNNSKIRADRAAAIGEDTQLIYKREVEDIEIQIKKLKREQENMLDLSPTSADSLVLASDFDTKGFVTRDLDLTIKIRNLVIKYNLARDRYAYLFGVSVGEALTETSGGEAV
jgi:hypothetical protein